MTKEYIAKAVTIEEAIEKAAAELGVDRDACQVEVLETPRKGLFGKIREASVKVTAEIPDEVAPVEEAAVLPSVPSDNIKLKTAQEYLRNILDAMKLSNVTMKITENEDGGVITFDGDGIAVLIGHHGETLDALQYLIALTCNRLDGEYYRITLDCGNYREKREATLRSLASRIAAKVKKSGRSQILEPMNPYERRIIHSVVSTIDGVYSKSKGEEPNRRVVILSETPVKTNGGNRGDGYSRRRTPPKRERTMEEILKDDLKKREESSDQLYSKIEL